MWLRIGMRLPLIGGQRDNALSTRVAALAQPVANGDGRLRDEAIPREVSRGTSAPRAVTGGERLTYG